LPLGQICSGLQQQGAFTDAGITTHQHQGARHQATAQDPIELGKTRAKALHSPLPHSSHGL
jgi:hypothetical protein